MTGADQPALFDKGEWWTDLWRGMPEFVSEDQESFHRVSVLFRNRADAEAFSRLMDQDVNWDTELPWSLWYPEKELGVFRTNRWVNLHRRENPVHPVYVISKGRSQTLHTVRSLEWMKVPYKLVVEPQEFEEYAKRVPESKMLALPFSNLGQGSIPARNWVWDHAAAAGHAKSWIIDDNINRFYRLNRNAKHPVATGAIFRAMESFCARYENVALAGPQYELFVPRRSKHPALYLNTRVYSCILVNHAVPFRWRGRYNEDTDLSLRCLKDGWATVLFVAFLANKIATMRVPGGNTAELYKGDGRRLMAESLREQHPDVVTVTYKWNRYQHQVNYEPFRNNALRPRRGISWEDGPNEFGMTLKQYPPGDDGWAAGKPHED